VKKINFKRLNFLKNSIHPNVGEWSLKFPILLISFINRMSVQEDFRKKNKPVNIKAVFDIVMGLIYAVVGVALVASKYIGLEINFPPAEVVTIFGAFATLYGLFRVYRGYITYKQD
jgi:hypothetical protein